MGRAKTENLKNINLSLDWSDWLYLYWQCLIMLGCVQNYKTQQRQVDLCNRPVALTASTLRDATDQIKASVTNTPWPQPTNLFWKFLYIVQFLQDYIYNWMEGHRESLLEKETLKELVIKVKYFSDEGFDDDSDVDRNYIRLVSALW